MKHLFEVWESFSSDVIAAAHVLLLSDYDGTLTPIVSRPEEALIPAEVRAKLSALSRKSDYSVGVISGRSLAEIRSLVGLAGIYYAGNHGLEVEGPGLKFVNPVAEVSRGTMARLYRDLSNKLLGVRGVIVEDKGLTLSVHYRLVEKSEVNRVTAIFCEVTSRWLSEDKIKVSAGKKVWEVRPPVDWHKGKAVETIIHEIKRFKNLKQSLTLYLGDDATDEDVFAVVRRPEGWSIFVGGENSQSRADYFLNSASEVEIFLSRLLELR